MHRFIKIAIGTAVLAAALPGVADAKSWQSISSRHAKFEARIAKGMHSGGLTRREATQLRSDFRNLTAREARYRHGGLDAAERRDLNARFDALSTKVFVQRHDFQNRSR